VNPNQININMIISFVCQVSMTLPLSRQRPQVVIPAQGMIEVRDTLTDLLNEFGIDDKGTHFLQCFYVGVNKMFLIIAFKYGLNIISTCKDQR